MAEENFKYITKVPRNDEQKEDLIHIDFTRFLTFDARKLSYRSRKLEFKPALHWGQRKLLLSEIEFLTIYGHLAETVLYVGAADGKHIAYLSELFPTHSFLLYDPNPFDSILKEVKNIKIFSQFFTDEDALKYKDTAILFISDIRNMPENYIKKFSEEDEMNDDIESNVKEDMDLQKKWVETILPKASMLKFRLPYTPGNTEYFSGDIFYQPWAPPTSTETRIVVDLNKNFDTSTGKFKLQTYNNTDYESIMYRFNRCTRIQPYSMYENCSAEIIKSYDLVAECYILHQYLLKIKKLPDNVLIQLLITKLSNEISDKLGKSFGQKYKDKVKIHNLNVKNFSSQKKYFK